MTNEEAHRIAREKGVSRVLYAIVRALFVPVMRLFYRLHVGGKEHIPVTGAAIVAPNHKSFWDSFFIALATKRHLRFMGKAELFEGRKGRLLIRLGAFPVRRGESDAEALETARTILRQGGLLALFPEGTRVRDGGARLARAAAPPASRSRPARRWSRARSPAPRSSSGTGSRARRASRWRLPPRSPSPSSRPRQETATELIEHQVWPEVQREYGRLKARPTLAAAALAAVGLGGVLLSRRRRK